MKKKSTLESAPLPKTRRGAPRKYNFGDIAVTPEGHDVTKKPIKNNSLFIKGKSPAEMWSSLKNYKLKNPGTEFVCQKEKGGVRIWRTK